MNQSEVSGVRAARRGDVPAMARVLTAGFMPDELTTWVQPDAALRAPMLDAVFSTAMRWRSPVEEGSEVTYSGVTVTGVAAWTSPGRAQVSWWRNVAALPGMFRGAGRGNLDALKTRGLAVEKAMAAAHPSEPHWYLAALAVDPTQHGLGLGSALVRSGLSRSAQTGQPAYLECLERLVPFYESHGFTVRHAIPLPLGAPAHLGMWHSA